MTIESINNDDPNTTNKKGMLYANIICWILGNGSLFAWNSMLTIQDYYAHIFPNYHPTRILTLCYQPCAFLTVGIFLYYEEKVNTRLRNLAGYSLFFLSSALLIVLDVATKGSGGLGPFVGVCVLSGTFGFADAFCQGGMVGDLSLMCPQFMQSFFAGLAASGVMTSMLRFITKAAFEKSDDGLRKGATLFFTISALFELGCVVVYAFVFPKIPVVRYYRMKAASEGSKTVTADLTAAGVQQRINGGFDGEDGSRKVERLSVRELLSRNIDYGLDLYFIYALTLSIFPGFLSEDTGSHSLGDWYVLVLIAMYNAWDLIGRYTPYIKFLHIKNRKWLMGAILSRLLFIPAFYFTAKYGDQGYMIMLTSLLGFTNGHLTVCVMTEAPKGYNGPEQNALGNLLCLFLLGGLFSGVTLDWLWLIGKGW